MSPFGTSLLFALALSGAGQTTPAPGDCVSCGKWWTNDRVVQRLSLSGDQVSRIDAVYERHRQPLLDLQAEVRNRQQALARSMEQPSPRVSAVEQQIDELELARAQLSKVRARMLIEMREVLGSHQRERLAALGREGCDCRGSRPSGAGSRSR